MGSRTPEMPELEPTYSYGYHRLGLGYTEKGRYEDAIAALETAVRLSGGATNLRAALGRAYALSGRTRESRRVLEELLDLNQRSYVGPLQIAIIHTALGETDEALRWLEKAYRGRDANMVLMKVLPGLDPLRDHPRFRDLLQRMKFP